MEEVLQRLRQRKIVQWAVAYAATAFALIQMIDLIAQRFGWPESIGRTLIVAAALGFCITLVLAWYHGERGMQRVTGTELLIVALLLAIGGSLLWRVARTPQENSVPVAAGAASPLAKSVVTPDGKSIAVLPFANTSGDPSNEYFSDGLSEELISVLARIPDLKIIGRNSSFHFKDSRDDSRSIGEQLGVAHLLEGSVRKQGDRVRIAVDLITAADGRQLWSETYDRDLKDIFAVQSEIAGAVVQQLKVQLLGPRVAEGGAGDTNPNIPAYNAFLQGQHLFGNFNEVSVHEAAGYFEEATRLDPAYALAYAQLSRAWRSLAGSFTTNPAEIDDASSRARSAALTALKLSPELSEGHAALGSVLLTVDLDPARAEPELRRAVALAPNDALNVHSLAYLLAAQGKLVEAEAMSRLALALDPKSVSPYLNIARIQIASHRLDDAEAILREAIRVQPDASHAYAYLTMIDLARNDPAAALRDAALEPAGFWREFAEASAMQAQPDRAAADRALQGLIERYRLGAPFQIAIVYAIRKEPEKVFEWLDNAYQQRDSGLSQLMVTPFLLDYRDDPRFAALMAKLNIAPLPADRPR